jgi:phosphate transport system substrate-binding protein
MIDGTTDIAMASRDLKTEEKMKFLKKDWTSYNYDALTVMLIQQTRFLN